MTYSKVMNSKEEETLKRLMAIFRIEAEEHIQAIALALIELEKTAGGTPSPELTEQMFRDAHSLKGAARSVNLRVVESVCQAVESIFSSLKNNEISLSPESFDLLHKAVDIIRQLVSLAGEKQTATAHLPVKELIEQLQNSAIGAQQPTPAKTSEEKQAVALENKSGFHSPVQPVAAPGLPTMKAPAQAETIRIAREKLNPLFLQAEEMVQAKIATAERVTELQSLSDSVESWKMELKKWKNRLSVSAGAQHKEWMEWNGQRLNETEQKILAMVKVTESDKRIIGRMVDTHLEAMKTILMLPVATLVEIFPVMARELARDQHKELDLILQGTEIEVDKRILEELKDPLIHLLRNCVDHGIAKPHEREQKNKPARGTITLAFSATESNQLEIVLSDDGSGIDLEKVCAAAVRGGFISGDAVSKLSIPEKTAFIFQSGVSTNPLITDISGRGLGMAIVKEKVAKLGGILTVESQPDLGTTFRIRLPLSLSTFRGVLVRAGNQVFVVPIIYVERVLSIKNEDIKTVENRETISVDGQIISLAGLGNVLGMPASGNGHSGNLSEKDHTDNLIRIVIIAYTGTRIAFQVDEVIGEQQVLVKELGKQLKRVPNISGVVVLGSAKVVPVINVSDLMKSATRTETTGRKVLNKEELARKVLGVLVVDDSITSRTLIRNILESAGYKVVTAVDGADAFAKALAGEFDLIVSDVDMPVMNGFELTVKVRKDKKLAELPVVLVTALDSRKDREYGIEVGANAYIIKSSFDQSNLLEVVGRLI